MTYPHVAPHVSFFLMLNTKKIYILIDGPHWPILFISLLWKSMGDQQIFGSSKYLLLCSALERNLYRFGTTWGSWSQCFFSLFKFFLRWTIPLLLMVTIFFFTLKFFLRWTILLLLSDIKQCFGILNSFVFCLFSTLEFQSVCRVLVWAFRDVWDDREKRPDAEAFRA